MPFLVLDRGGNPMVGSETGLIRHFDTREEAEVYRKSHNGARVIEVPFLSQ